MKKSLAVLSLIFILSSCAKTNEVGENDIITSFYADYNENVYEISAEILDLKNKEKTAIKTAHGETIELAYANLMKAFEKPAYPGHAGALVLGSGMCTGGLKETINFFSDINIISPNISVMLTEDRLDDFEANSVYNSIKNESLTKMPLYTLFIPENKTAFIPVISSISGVAQNTGGIIAEDFIFKYYIDEKSSEIHGLITNNFEKNFYDSYEILKSDCKLKNDNGTLKVNLRMRIKNLREKDNEKISLEIKKDITELTEKLIENNLCSLLKKGDFKATEIFLDTTVADTGKLKKAEE